MTDLARPMSHDDAAPLVDAGHARAVVAVTSSCGIAVALTQTAIVPLIPLLPGLLDARAADTAWAVTITLLVAAVSMPIAGRLGDMIGKRRVLIGSMTALLIGSVLSGLADNLSTMILGRGLQGASLGAISLGISIIRDELPGPLIGPAVARVSATLGVGGAFGLPVAAILVEHVDWRSVFWLSAAVAAGCLVAVARVIPESPVRSPGRFDVIGAVGLSVALVGLLLSVGKGGEWGWLSVRTLAVVGGSLLVLAAWSWWELRSSTPLVDLRTSARAQVLFTNIASIAVGFTLYGMSLIPIQILLAPSSSEYGLGLSLTQAGLVLMPGGLMMYLCSSLGARISAARGPRTSLLTGIGVLALGYLLVALFRDEWWHLSLAVSLTSAGVGIAYAAMPALIMGAVPITMTAAANGLNALMRSIGTSLSGAVIGAILASGGGMLPQAGSFTTAALVSLGAAGLAAMLTLLIPARSTSA